MRKLLLSTLALAALSAAPLSAHAQGLPDATLSLSGGTLGFGPELGLRYPEYPIGLRLGYNTFEMSHNFRERGTAFRGTAETGTFGATVDAYPFNTGFRLSVGFRAGENEIRVRSRPSSAIRIGDNTYSAADIGQVSGRASFNEFSPYAGLGYTTTFLNDNLSLSLDAGVTYLGKADVSLRATGPLAAAAARDVERERREIQDRFSDYRFYPVVQVTLGYKF